MPSPVFKGSFPAIISEATNQTNDGTYQYVVTKIYSFSTLVTPSIGILLTRDGNNLSLTSFNISSKEGLATITETYTGADSSAPDIYEVVATTQEEPIASHPAFTASTTGFSSSIVSAAGGRVTEGTGASGGVIFDADGGFVGFTKTATNNFIGIQSYLSPRVSYKRTYSVSSVPTIGERVSYIYSTPNGNPPQVDSGRNWILTGVSWQNVGNEKTLSGQYKVTEEYLLSGIKGWNNAIYYTEN
jgi:hypothetical protein